MRKYTTEMHIRGLLSEMLRLTHKLTDREKRLADGLEYLLGENFRLWSILKQAGIDADARSKGTVGS